MTNAELPLAIDAVLDAVAGGIAVRRALADQGVDTRDFYRAIQADAGLAQRYARVKLDALEAMADEAIAIADNEKLTPESRRIRVDVRKWHLSKLAPKKYGDRLELAGDAANPIQVVVTPVDGKL